MKKMIRLNWKFIIGYLLASSLVFAGAIKTWNAGDTLTSADLNSNFQHIHNSMVGGHGGRLLDADVSGSAAIASSKLAQGKGFVDGYGYYTCSSGVCTTQESNNATVARSAVGVYTVTTTGTTAPYAVLVSIWNVVRGDSSCQVTAIAGSVATIKCWAIAAALDADFSVIIIDF